MEDDSSERILKLWNWVAVGNDVDEVEDDSSERILKHHQKLTRQTRLQGSGRRFFRENTETRTAAVHRRPDSQKWKTILQREY